MDLSKIKSKLSELSDDRGRKEKVDYEKVFWRPSLGKSQVRIVPSVYTPEYPFTELLFHYNVGKYPMIALSNFGKQDPIEEFIKELKKTNDSDNWSLAGKLTPRVRTFAPVVVRGEEDQGVRLWGFSKTVYRSLLSLAEDEDIGDYSDPVTGFDLVVEQIEKDPYNETTVRIKPKQTPLSEDGDQVEKWLKEQPNPKEVYTQYDYDFMKKQLAEYLGEPTENETEGSSESSNIGEVKESTSEDSFTLTDTTKEKELSRFDELFGSDK